MGEDEEKETRGKGTWGSDGDAALCLPAWFPSQLVQGCLGGCSSCTSALPPHASPRALGWSRVGSSASCTPSCQLCASAASWSPRCRRIQPYPGMAASGQMCFPGRKGGVCVCVWGGLLLIMCTLGRAGLVVRAQEWTGEPRPGATASSWSHYPSLSQVPQILEARVAQLPTPLGPRGSQRVGCVRTGALLT